LQLKKAHGQSLTSEDIGGNQMACKNTIT